MSRVVYYESGAFSRETWAREAGPGVTHVIADDVDVGGVDVERVPHDRRREVLDAAILRTEKVFGSLAARGLVLEQDGVSLAEASWFGTAVRLARPLHRRALLGLLAERWRPDVVTWFVSPESHVDYRTARLLAQAGSALGMSVDLRIAGGRRAALTALVNDAYVIAHRGRALARGQMQRRASERVPAGGVVFTTFFPTSVSVVAPLARSLAERGSHEVCWVAGRPEVAAALGTTDVNLWSLDAFDPAFVARRWLGFPLLARATRRALARLTATELGEEVDTPPEVLRYVGRVVGDALATTLAEASWFAASWTAAVRALRPSVVVSTNHSNVFDRCAALAARRAGARSIFVQHGLLTPDRSSSTFSHDVALVWGELDARILREAGAGGEFSVLPVGSAAHRTGPARPPTTPPRVLFFASRTGGSFVSTEAAREAALAAARAVARLGNATLTVKLHPADHSGVVERVLAGMPHVSIVATGRSADLAASHDVVIAMSSTTIYDACLASRPLVLFGTYDVGFDVCIEEGAALVARTEDELLHALDAGCHDPTTRARLVEGCARFAKLAMQNTGERAVASAVDAITAAIAPRPRGHDHGVEGGRYSA